MWFRLWTLCNVHLINWTLSCSLHVTCNIPYLIFSVPAFWKLHHSLFFKALKHKIVQEESYFLLCHRRRNTETSSLKDGLILRKRSVLSQSHRLKLKNSPIPEEKRKFLEIGRKFAERDKEGLFNKGKRLHKKRGRRLVVLEHKYGRHDVM